MAVTARFEVVEACDDLGPHLHKPRRHVQHDHADCTDRVQRGYSSTLDHSVVQRFCLEKVIDGIRQYIQGCRVVTAGVDLNAVHFRANPKSEPACSRSQISLPLQVFAFFLLFSSPLNLLLVDTSAEH